MDEQLAIQKLLRSQLLIAQIKNPKYSLRSFSRKLGINAGALSSIINGKRNVSKDMAGKITRKLLIDPQERTEILNLFPEIRKYRNTEEMKQDEGVKYLEIEASTFKLIAEWEHFAVLSLLKTTEFKNDYQWISKRLGVSKFRVQEVVERLLWLGFLVICSEGNLKRVMAAYRSSDETVNLSVRKSHDENFELARESLQRDSIKERDFTSVTMAINPEKMSIAKEMIRKFQDELAEAMESGPQSEVYRLSMQLFPLSKLSNPKRYKESLQ
jgi:uncharacterized protein (TIGR02147 family)